MIDRTIGHYRIVERLAQGGMGVIYRAEDLTLHRPVALKFLSHETASDEEYRARFLREARVAAALNHPNTCTVYEVGVVDFKDDCANGKLLPPPGTPFIAMEFIEGETLAARLGRVERLDPRDVLELSSQIAEGLAEAHARGIVHRDVKPQNIMITSGGLVKIVDFGLAKPLQASRSGPALVSTSEMISADLGDVTIIGTCAYMSPEQVSGRKVDARSDIFAFGSTLYQMLSGRLPFRGDTATVVLAKILEAEPDPLEPDADVHYTALSRIARRCLHKRAELRYADAGSLLTDLETIRSEVVPLSPARVRFGTPARIAVVGVALIGAVLAYPRTGPTTPDTNLPGKTPPAAVTDSSAMPPPPIQLTGNAPEKSRHIPPERNPAAPKVPSTVAKVPGASNTNDTATPSDSTRRETNVGKLVLDSNPEASVSLDNRLIGITPLTLETSPGMHDLVMTSSDGLRWRGKVDVAAEGETRIERDLAAFGQLTITSDVWVEVSLDGGSPEQTPVRFARVPAGLHELRAYREGFVTQTLEIFIEEDKTRHIRVKLERKP